MSSCQHDLASKETACVDGLCPLCLRARVQEFEDWQRRTIGELEDWRDELVRSGEQLAAEVVIDLISEGRQ